MPNVELIILIAKHMKHGNKNPGLMLYSQNLSINVNLPVLKEIKVNSRNILIVTMLVLMVKKLSHLVLSVQFTLNALNQLLKLTKEKSGN